MGEDLPPDAAPGAALFARAACAIQHTGVGSIAIALRQGCPLVIEPFAHDQFYNARRAVELGAGLAVHPYETIVDGMVQAMKAGVLTSECRQRVETPGVSHCADDG